LKASPRQPLAVPGTGGDTIMAVLVRVILKYGEYAKL
jgi:hypothetical protein